MNQTSHLNQIDQIDQIAQIENSLKMLETLHFTGWGLFLVKIVVLLLVGLIATGVIKYFFHRFLGLMKKRKADWAGLGLKAAYAPILGMLWFLLMLSVVRISFGFAKSAVNFNPEDYNFLNYAFELGVLWVCVWFCIRLLKNICDRWLMDYKNLKKSSGSAELLLDPTSILVIRRVGFILISVIAVLIALGIMNIPLSGLLTFGGISGAALAFASQSMIANFFGGLFIYFDRPFAIGDWISSPERNLEGVVEHIGWRLTLIRSLDKRPIYVPNSVFTSSIIVNPSRMTHRRINQNITLSYADAEKLPDIMENIRQLLKNSPEIDQSCPNAVSLLPQDALNSSGMSINIYAFTAVTDSLEFKALQDQILLKIEEIIRKAEAKISTLTH
jgi:MscS family membrane protein